MYVVRIRKLAHVRNRSHKKMQRKSKKSQLLWCYCPLYEKQFCYYCRRSSSPWDSSVLLLSLPFFQTEKMASSAISICFNDHVNASPLSPMCVCSAETTFPPSILSIYSVLFCTTVQQRPLYCCRQLLLWCTRHSSVFELASFAFDTLYVVFLSVFYDIAIFTEHEYICEKALKKNILRHF